MDVERACVRSAARTSASAPRNAIIRAVVVGWRAAQSPPDLRPVSTDSDSMASLRLLALAATLALASGEAPGLELATKLS